MQIIRILIAAVALLGLPGVALSADMAIASWNIEHLGNGDRKSFPALATVGANFDFIAVQEVMSLGGLEKLKVALEQETGQPWETMYSHLVGRGSYKEMYAFIWNTAQFEYVDGAVVYLDRGDRFAREPFSARFREKRSGYTFVAATVHILYGKSRESRVPEILTLREYWEWLQSIYPDTENIFLLGDFNLPPNDPAWAPLKEVAQPLITQGASTLSSIDGRFANLYDNIWVPRARARAIKSAAVYNYPLQLGWTHDKARAHASDHAPVYALVGDATLRSADSRNPNVVRNTAGLDSNHRARPQRNSAAPAQYAAVAVRGNKRSKVYHLPQCPSYGKISSNNIVEFSTTTDAEHAGYRKAGNCG